MIPGFVASAPGGLEIIGHKKFCMTQMGYTCQPGPALPIFVQVFCASHFYKDKGRLCLFTHLLSVIVVPLLYRVAKLSQREHGLGWDGVSLWVVAIMMT